MNAPNHFLISSVRVTHGPGHDTVEVWNRGGKAGELTVNKGEGTTLARVLVRTPCLTVAGRTTDVEITKPAELVTPDDKVIGQDVPMTNPQGNP